MTPKVIVTQQSLMRDPNTGAWKPKFDLTPASQYGKLEYVFGAGQIAVMPEALVDAIDERLQELKYDPGKDFLLSTGDIVVAVAVALRMAKFGPVRMLRWERRIGGYNVVEGL